MGHRTSKFLTNVVYEEGVTEEDCVRIFNYFDTDKDGKLNYNESKRFAQKLFKYNEDLWKETFLSEEAFVAATMKYLDINNDGELGWDEMERQRRARLITSQKNKRYDHSVVFTKVRKNVLAAVPDTSTAIDLPRLSSKITIMRDGKTICTNDKEEKTDPGAPRMKQVLLGLVSALDLNPEISRLIREYDLATDFPRKVDGMFEVLAANGGQQVLGVLKACTQTCVAPPACALKALLRGTLQYRDHRGSWKIAVHVTGTEVTVSHTKKETTPKPANDEPGPEVNMQWTFLVRFSRPQWEVIAVDFRVDRLDFNHLVLDHQRDNLIATLGDLYSPNQDLSANIATPRKSSLADGNSSSGTAASGSNLSSSSIDFSSSSSGSLPSFNSSESSSGSSSSLPNTCDSSFTNSSSHSTSFSSVPCAGSSSTLNLSGSSSSPSGPKTWAAVVASGSSPSSDKRASTSSGKRASTSSRAQLSFS